MAILIHVHHSQDRSFKACYTGHVAVYLRGEFPRRVSQGSTRPSSPSVATAVSTNTECSLGWQRANVARTKGALLRARGVEITSQHLYVADIDQAVSIAVIPGCRITDIAAQQRLCDCCEVAFCNRPVSIYVDVTRN